MQIPVFVDFKKELNVVPESHHKMATFTHIQKVDLAPLS